MKALFWNIGSDLTDRKLHLISEAIASEKPDIFCIAEGTKTKANCQMMIDQFLKHSFTCYYSPLFAREIQQNIANTKSVNRVKTWTNFHRAYKDEINLRYCFFKFKKKLNFAFRIFLMLNKS